MLETAVHAQFPHKPPSRRQTGNNNTATTRIQSKQSKHTTYRIASRPRPGLSACRHLIFRFRTTVIGVYRRQGKDNTGRILIRRAVAAHALPIGWEQARARDEGIERKGIIVGSDIVVFVGKMMMTLIIAPMRGLLEALQKVAPISILDGLDSAPLFAEHVTHVSFRVRESIGVFLVVAGEEFGKFIRGAEFEGGQGYDFGLKAIIDWDAGWQTAGNENVRRQVETISFHVTADAVASLMLRRRCYCILLGGFRPTRKIGIGGAAALTDGSPQMVAKDNASCGFVIDKNGFFHWFIIPKMTAVVTGKGAGVALVAKGRHTTVLLVLLLAQLQSEAV